MAWELYGNTVLSTFARLVQYVGGNYYDGSGNLLSIGSKVSAAYVDGSIAVAVDAVDTSLVTYIDAYNSIQDTSVYAEVNQIEASLALITITTDYVDGSIATAVDAVDTSLITYTDAAITTALDASFPLYETKLNINSSLNNKISYGADASSLTNIQEENVIISEVGTTTYQTLEDFIDLTASAGKLTGGGFTDLGDGSLYVGAGTGLIRSSNDPSAELFFFDWDASTLNDLTDNTTNYIHVDYNSGNPMIGSATSLTANNRNTIALGKAFREDDAVHPYPAGMVISEATKNILSRFVQTEGEITRASGAVVSDYGDLMFAVTAGVIWGGLTRFVTSEYDPTATDFEYYYTSDSGSTWTETDASLLDSANYNDITSGLTAIASQQYGINWIYADGGGDILVVYGQDTYKLGEAQDAQPPATLPNHVSQFAFLAAKIITAKDGTSFIEIENAYDIGFTSSTAGVHNDLGGLQGGTSDQYQHLTTAEHTSLLAGETITGSLRIDSSLQVDGSVIIQTSNDASLYWLDVDITGSLVANIIS